MQLIRIGSTKFTEQFWKHEGWAIRQPAVEPVYDTMDMTDISTELARQAGVLKEYVQAINRGAAGMGLKGRGDKFDYSLDAATAPACADIWNRICLAASHELSAGEEVHDLAWFRENGFMLRPFPQLDWYSIRRWSARTCTSNCHTRSGSPATDGNSRTPQGNRRELVG